MAARCRAFDWASTPLGPVSAWSQSLRTIVAIMLESRHPMFLWWGPDLIQIFNDGYKPSFGGSGRDVAALGARGREHWAEIWDIIGPQIEQVMTTGKATWHEDHLVPIERNGIIDNVFWTYGYSPVRDDDGSINGVLVVVQETTQRMNALTDLENARAEADDARIAAEAANRVKSEFLATMSHELRTPLNAIAGYAQLLELGVHGPVNDDQRTALKRIQRAEQHLLSLVNDVLNFAKLEAGRIDYHVTSVRLVDAVSSVAPMVEPQLAEKLLDFEITIPNDLVVRADVEKLEQILVNLMSNAIKFTESGGRIAMSAEGSATEGEPSSHDVVSLHVSDSGVGIPLDRQDLIFDPFVQIDRHLMHTPGGTGLGLAISRDLARGMGGDLRVRSAPGEGSTFTITLASG